MPTFSFPDAPQMLTQLLQCGWNAPLPINIAIKFTASVLCLMPDYYPRPIARLVSCYALVK